MLKLYLCNDSILVWNADDICTLRKKHRIVGSLIGLHPNKPHQTKISHVPLQLMPEEAKLLLDKDIARLFYSPDDAPDQSVIEHYYERREKICTEQIALNKENRLKEIREKSSSAKAAEIEVDNVKAIPKEDTMIQIFTECPWKKYMEAAMPSKYCASPEDKLKYAVFKDLWEKKFFITNGSKFGGDFLAYAGDPIQYHSMYIIVCFPPSKTAKALDLVFYGRLGHQVKKTVALASFNEMQEVEYLSLEYISESSGEWNTFQET